MVLCLCFVLVQWVLQCRDYSAEYDNARSHILALNNQSPPGADKEHWETAVTWSCNAFVETFMFRDLADLDALRRFNQGFDERLGHVPPQVLLEWIWDELQRCSPRGSRYVDRFREDFREQLELAKNPPR
jgi:hypothetical protein